MRTRNYGWITQLAVAASVGWFLLTGCGQNKEEAPPKTAADPQNTSAVAVDNKTEPTSVNARLAAIQGCRSF